MTMMELQERMSRCIVDLDAAETPEQREIELETCRIIEKVSKQMINNARFILDAEKLEAQLKTLTHSRASDLIG